MKQSRPLPKTHKENPTPFIALCRLCGKPVPLETANTNDDGKAVHENCYALKITLEFESRDGHGS